MNPWQAFFTGTLWAMLTQHSRNGPSFHFVVEQKTENDDVAPEILIKMPKDKVVLRVKIELVSEGD